MRYGTRRAASRARRSSRRPAAGGYTFEAVVPWASLPELRTTRVGVHGYAAYVDGDGNDRDRSGRRAAPARHGVDPERAGAVDDRAAPPAQGLTKRAPDVELVADLTGDGVRERVAVWETYTHDLRHGVPRRHRLLLPRPSGAAREARGARRDRARQGRRHRPAQAERGRRRARVPRGAERDERHRGAARDLRARDRGAAERPPHRQRGAPGPRRDRGERRADDELGPALVQGADRERRRADPLPVGRREDAALQVRRIEVLEGQGGHAAARRSRPAAAPWPRPTGRRRVPSSRRRRRSARAATSSGQMLEQYRKDRRRRRRASRPRSTSRCRSPATRGRSASFSSGATSSSSARASRAGPGTRSSRCSSSRTRATSRISRRATSPATARRTWSCAACATRRATPGRSTSRCCSSTR